MFMLTYAMVVACLAHVSWRGLRERRWPPALNGMLSVCFLCLSMLGISALLGRGGSVFAAGFTVLALLVLLAMAMHRFAGPGVSAAECGFAIAYAAAALCSASYLMSELVAASLPDASGLVRALHGALPAGQILIAAAGGLAFLAFHEMPERRLARFLILVTSALAAAGMAAGMLLLPHPWAFLDGPVGAGRAAVLSASVFLSLLTVQSCLVDPGRWTLGAGLALMLMAGYPMRIAEQQML